MTERKAKRPTRPVREWKGMMKRAFEDKYIGQSHVPNFFLRLGAVCALFGEIGDSRANKVYWALVALFANRKRRSRWGKALDLIPGDREQVWRMAECVSAYGRHVEDKTGVPLREENFKLDRVVKVMLQVRNADTFVRDRVGDGMFHAGAIFHPNTLERAKKEYKGVYGYGGDGDYFDQMSDGVEKV